MKIITPVIIEDSVVHLLRNIDTAHKFSKVYKCAVSETILVRAWFNIKWKSWIFKRSEIAKSQKLHKINNLSLKWFKKTNQKLVLYKHIFKVAQTPRFAWNKNNKYSFVTLNLYDRIIQKAFFRILCLIFEGRFYWEKSDKKMIEMDHFFAADWIQTVKRKNRKEYWIRRLKIKPIFTPISHGFSLQKEVSSAIQEVRTWNPVWLASCKCCFLFKEIHGNIFSEKLEEHFKDIQFIDQIIKIFKIQFVGRNYNLLRSVSVFPQNSPVVFLLLNFYMDLLDKFAAKTIKSVTKQDSIKQKSKLLIKIKKLIYVRNQQIVGPFRKNRTKLWTKFFKHMLSRVYYVRYNCNFLMGFFSTKTQSKLVLESTHGFIKNSLKLDLSAKLLVHMSSDSIQFLGFAIQRTSMNTLKYSANKKAETFKRCQNRILGESVQEYRKFLKIMEWLGRKAVAAMICEKPVLWRHVLKKKLKETVISRVPRKNWFYYGHRLNIKMNSVFRFCYENKERKLKKLANAPRNLLFSRESLEWRKVLGKNQINRLYNSNKKIKQFLTKSLGLECDKTFFFKLQLKNKSFTHTQLAQVLHIFPFKKQIIVEFKRKKIINLKEMPGILKSKMILSDCEIMYWYSVIGKRLFSYYSYVDSFHDIKRCINWNLKYSLFATIGAKYKKSMSWTAHHFGFYPKVICTNKVVIHFPSLKWVDLGRKKVVIQVWSHSNLNSIFKRHLFLLNRVGVLLENKSFKSM